MCNDPEQIALQLGVHPSLAALQSGRREVVREEYPGGASHAIASRLCRVVVVTTAYNRKATTLQGLRSLLNANRNGMEIHVIVVDDGSTDGTGEAIRSLFPEVELIRGDGNLWFARASNLGLRTALGRQPDYILWTNDDSLFHEQFLVHLIRCAHANPKSVIGALLRRWDSPEQVYQCSPQWDTWYGGWRWPRHLTIDAVPRDPWQVDFIPGNCVLLPRQAIDQLGLLKERALPQHADAEYTPRMRKAGWRLLIEPQAWVWIQPNDIAPSTTVASSWREVPKTTLLRELFLDRRKARSLSQEILIRWHSAPSQWLGLVAFGVGLVRRGLRLLGVGGTWPNWPDPQPAFRVLTRA